MNSIRKQQAAYAACGQAAKTDSKTATDEDEVQTKRADLVPKWLRLHDAQAMAEARQVRRRAI
jgi:hypothetical protein